jgi:hypothetical protein
MFGKTFVARFRGRNVGPQTVSAKEPIIAGSSSFLAARLAAEQRGNGAASNWHFTSQYLNTIVS